MSVGVQIRDTPTSQVRSNLFCAGKTRGFGFA
jgi:hypothetical protein